MASSKGIIEKIKDAAASVSDFVSDALHPEPAPAPGKSVARKKTAAKKVSAKTPTKKTAAKKAVVAKKSAAKKVAAKKAPAKKAASKKTTHTKRGMAQDRREVSAGQASEVRYEAKKMGVSPVTVKKAIKKVGNQRKAIEAELKKSKKP